MKPLELAKKPKTCFRCQPPNWLLPDGSTRHGNPYAGYDIAVEQARRFGLSATVPLGLPS
jgi:hypothetical protein